MRSSIRTRFALVFAGLTALILIITWCVNSWWLEDFYTVEKVRILENAYTQVDREVRKAAEADSNIIEEYQKNYDKETEEPGSAQELFRLLSEKYNTTIVLIDSGTDTVLFPNAKDSQFLSERVQRYIFGQTGEETEVLRSNDNYTIQKTYDRRSRSSYLESWGFFSDDRTIFLMTTPLVSIRESAALSSRFLSYVGIATLVLGCIMVYFTAKRITSPILKLAELSEKMSNLDFEAKYTGDAADEIGILGNSMNTLSDKLKETIGELKSANLELQKDIQEKIRVDEMRKDFIANVSHELKTPIALIQGYAEGLTEGMCEDEESRNYYCEVIVDEANKMNKMVRQLLTLTALEFGNDTLALERFDLTELIKGVVGAASIFIQQKNAQVCLNMETPVYVWADEFKIEEVVTNYLSNALNHLGGERRIEITAAVGEREVRVSVFNSGNPIPEEDLPNLWTKFFKVDKSHTREYGGSGIGLSIVKAVMDSHHKECGVRNVEGGVEFWFTLDCSDDATAEAGRPEAR